MHFRRLSCFGANYTLTSKRCPNTDAQIQMTVLHNAAVCRSIMPIIHARPKANPLISDIQHGSGLLFLASIFSPVLQPVLSSVCCSLLVSATRLSPSSTTGSLRSPLLGLFRLLVPERLGTLSLLHPAGAGVHHRLPVQRVQHTASTAFSAGKHHSQIVPCGRQVII